MLSVGRELEIHEKCVVCHTCPWEGTGAELSTGLIQLTPAHIYFYAYRCPECGSFELARKGKVLRFRPCTRGTPEDEHAAPAQPVRQMRGPSRHQLED